MTPLSSNSVSDTLFFGIPLFAFLVFGYFRLDEVFSRKGKHRRRERGHARGPRVGYLAEEEQDDAGGTHESPSVKPLPRRRRY